MAAKTERFNPAGSNLGATIRQSVDYIRGKSGANYTLVYLDPTVKHPIGSVENIMLPNITFGRGDQCHVKYGEQYSTVSRQQASITTGGNDFVLNQNPQAGNPTLVNGNPINGPTVLNNGDEIQFSVNGPRVRFNSMQSSVGGGAAAAPKGPGFTARLGSAISQATRPYKKALWLLGIALIGGLSFGGLSLYKSMSLSSDLKQTQGQYSQLQNQMTMKESQISDLEGKYKILSNKNSGEARRLKEQLEAHKSESAAMQAKIQELESREPQVIVREVQTAPPAAQPQQPNNSSSNVLNENSSNSNNASGTTGNSQVQNETPVTQQETPGNGASENNSGAVDFNKLANKDVYLLIAKRVEFENESGFQSLGVKELTPDESKNNGLWSGTGFMTNEGNFITARHVIQPWRFYDASSPDFRSFYYALNEAELEYRKINVVFELISPENKTLSLNSTEFKYNDSKDVLETHRTVENGKFLFFKKKGKKIDIKLCKDYSTDWAIHSLRKDKGKISEASIDEINTVRAGDNIYALGFSYSLATQPSAGNLSPLLSNGIISQNGLINGVINISNVGFGAGSSGGPVFKNINGEFKAIGIITGTIGTTTGVVVPMSNLN